MCYGNVLQFLQSKGVANLNRLRHTDLGLHFKAFLSWISFSHLCNGYRWLRILHKWRHDSFQYIFVTSGLWEIVNDYPKQCDVIYDRVPRCDVIYEWLQTCVTSFMNHFKGVTSFINTLKEVTTFTIHYQGVTSFTIDFKLARRHQLTWKPRWAVRIDRSDSSSSRLHSDHRGGPSFALPCEFFFGKKLNLNPIFFDLFMFKITFLGQ